MRSNRDERAQAAEISRKHKEAIVNHAESGRPPSGLEKAVAMPILAPVDAIVTALTLGGASVFQDRREELREWSQRINESWKMFGERKEEMLVEDRAGAFERLTEIKEECDEAWERLRAARGEAQEERQLVSEERERRHEEWRQRLEAKRERLAALLEKNEDVIERLEEQIADLEEKIDNAWNEEWADRARGWVEEKRNKIRDIEDTNGELEEKIKEIDERLSG